MLTPLQEKMLSAHLAGCSDLDLLQMAALHVEGILDPIAVEPPEPTPLIEDLDTWADKVKSKTPPKDAEDAPIDEKNE